MDVALFHNQLLENYDFLTPFALNLTRDVEQSKDLIQETFYRALKNKDKYVLGTNIKAWLFIIMRNIFINHYRKARKFKKVSDGNAAEWQLAQNGNTAHNMGPVSLGLQEINEAIGRLPKIFRESFLLHYHGFKYAEISKITQEPLGTIKSRIHFARKSLMQSLKRV